MVRFTTRKKAPIDGWQKGSVVRALATKLDHQRSVLWIYVVEGEKQLPPTRVAMPALSHHTKQSQ